MNFEEYILNSEDNLQTRYISGKGEFISDKTSVTQNDFEKAINHLENYFEFVGITEKFDESLLLLKEKLRWDYIYYEKKNVNSDRPKKTNIDRRLIDLIKEKNKYDLKLYEYAIKRNEEQLNKYIPNIDKASLKYKEEKKIYQYGYNDGYNSGYTIGYKKASKNVDIYREYYELISLWIKNGITKEEISKYFERNGLKNIGIYGIGTLGELLYKELQDSGIKISYFIDNKAESFRNFNEYECVLPHEIANKSRVDAIVVTPIYNFQEIRENLIQLGIDTNIISLNEVVSNLNG